MSNMSQSNPIQKEIWWKQPWPWIILGMLSSVVVASMVTIVIAVKTQDTL
ncbi:MAG: FixH family protein, partial [Burkholderiaceae bacterium]